ncbi:hypothetical protein [Herbaspirillum sp. YR522]|uniref:hypothetical protein n=1 Tax=Herbaspirillum sp. YR522 TaxID=1144342 RepID=UPI00026F7F23|nr:hypothetical protein [Herbaspirillum sp. YR522]EJN09186.1 hypothetical protein PMI40_00871 [Herbaspirillum sp. YR522]
MSPPLPPADAYRRARLRRRLLAPLIYFVALLLMLEQWLWEVTQAVLARIPAWGWLVRLQQAIQRLPPYAALVVFAAPTLLLLPVKLLALLSIGHGHPGLGLLIIVSAKILGTALVARVYALTRRSLLGLAWFKRWHDKLLAFKDRMIAQLHASSGWRAAQRLAATVRRWRGRLFAAGAPDGTRAPRLLRRLAARMKKQWRKFGSH